MSAARNEDKLRRFGESAITWTRQRVHSPEERRGELSPEVIDWMYFLERRLHRIDEIDLEFYTEGAGDA